MRKQAIETPKSRKLLGTMHKPVFFTSALLIIFFSFYGGAFSEHAAATFATIQSWLVTYMGWFYMGVVALFFIFILYVAAGFYLANTILKIDPSCGLHEGSLPNTWSTLVDHHEYTNVNRSILRKNFPFEDYYINDWQAVYFLSLIHI